MSKMNYNNEIEIDDSLQSVGFMFDAYHSKLKKIFQVQSYEIRLAMIDDDPGMYVCVYPLFFISA
jgi:hypothetical protein